MNNRITAKERGLIKGALRRAFSRSELRKEVVEESKIDYTDVNRPRVKKWSMCPTCLTATPTYKMQVDHCIPLIGITETLEELSWDDLVSRLWCDKSNLLAICIDCHKRKSKEENKARREYKKGLKK